MQKGNERCSPFPETLVFADFTSVGKKKIFMRSLKTFMVRFCRPCTNIWTPRVRRCVRKTKTKPLPPPKLRGKRGILLGKEPKERRKQKKSPKTGEIPKETESNPNRHSGAKKRAVGNERKIETGQRRAERVKQAITRDPQLTR